VPFAGEIPLTIFQIGVFEKRYLGQLWHCQQSGSNHTFMADAMVQGDSFRWLYGCKWIVWFLDK
jgi:hypothetical protein